MEIDARVPRTMEEGKREHTGKYSVLGGEKKHLTVPYHSGQIVIKFWQGYQRKELNQSGFSHPI